MNAANVSNGSTSPRSQYFGFKIFNGILLLLGNLTFGVGLAAIILINQENLHGSIVNGATASTITGLFTQVIGILGFIAVYKKDLNLFKAYCYGAILVGAIFWISHGLMQLTIFLRLPETVDVRILALLWSGFFLIVLTTIIGALSTLASYTILNDAKAENKSIDQVPC